MRKDDVKDRVRSIMEKHEDARNSDAWLIAKYWSLHHNEKVKRHGALMELLTILDRVQFNPLEVNLLEMSVIVEEIRKDYFNQEQQPIAMIKLIDIANTDHKKNQTTSPETIRRSRQLIQATGELLPTSAEVRRQRKISEDSYKVWCKVNSNN